MSTLSIIFLTQPQSNTPFQAWMEWIWTRFERYFSFIPQIMIKTAPQLGFQMTFHHNWAAFKAFWPIRGSPGIQASEVSCVWEHSCWIPKNHMVFWGALWIFVAISFPIFKGGVFSQKMPNFQDLRSCRLHSTFRGPGCLPMTSACSVFLMQNDANLSVKIAKTRIKYTDLWKCAAAVEFSLHNTLTFKGSTES